MYHFWPGLDQHDRWVVFDFLYIYGLHLYNTYIQSAFTIHTFTVLHANYETLFFGVPSHKDNTTKVLPLRKSGVTLIPTQQMTACRYVVILQYIAAERPAWLSNIPGVSEEDS